MAVQASCPNCGASIEFTLGSSLARVCDYCRHTVVRTDRGLQAAGKAADLAHTPSLIAVGDEGTLAGRPFRVFGRVQLDHGAGPWDEYYLGLDYGQSWGWLAYAQGEWYATVLAPPVPAPSHVELSPEQDVVLGPAGSFRVGEVKQARVVATEGEVPGGIREGMTRLYADLWGQGRAFATLDYGESGAQPALFLGYVLSEPELVVTQAGQRTLHKVKAATLECPNCGGDVPKLSGERAERLGCPYCGAVSDIALRTVVAQQEKTLRATDIPIGTQGTFQGSSFICIAYVRRGTSFEGEAYEWEEYLLFNQQVGFRWLIKDPETGWSWVSPVNLAEIDVRGGATHVTHQHRVFRVRNRNQARVLYVLGEVYWKCMVGETTSVADYVSGRDVLSREGDLAEVRWSLSAPMPWPVVARGFGLPVDGPGAPRPTRSGAGPNSPATIVAIVAALILLGCVVSYFDDGDGSSSSGGVIIGGGVFSGGK
ncbi:MAG TPA: DUF4178 domain-containing protein [Polyangiaceae bacterium]|nr:DUF4178 domain-containing protein [Polyangiaceae bacterium]